MAPKPRFSKGEKVLCAYGPLLYEAKVLKLDTSGEKMMYLIHYCGWNKKWDELVPESRILKYNRRNLQKQKQLEKAQKTKSVTKTAVKQCRSSAEAVQKSSEAVPLQRTSSEKNVKPKIDKKASAVLGFPVTQDYLIKVVEECAGFIHHMAEKLGSSDHDIVNI